MAKTPGDPHDSDDIIELTDIIERGPGAPRSDDSSGGVDLSFERELEDLFSDPPASGSKSQATSGLDDLLAPDSGPTTKGGDDDIDLAGLDDLLAEAEKSPPSPGSVLSDMGADLPDGFDDDLFNAPAPPAASLEPDQSGSRPLGSTMDALYARLDALEAATSGLADDLTDTFKTLLAQSAEALKAELSGSTPDLQTLETDISAKLDARLAEATAGVEAQIEGLKAELGAGAPDLQALEADIAAKLETRLSEASAGVDSRLEARLSEVTAGVEAQIEGLKAELSGSSPDPQALEADIIDKFETRLAEASAGVDTKVETRLGEATAEIEAQLEAIKADLAQTPPVDAAALAAEVKALLDAEPKGEGDNLAHLEESLAALSADMQAFKEVSDAQAPIDREALAGQVKAQVLAELPPVPDFGTELAALQDQLAALKAQVESGFAAHIESHEQASAAAVPAHEHDAGEVAAVKEALDSYGARLEGLEAAVAGLTAAPVPAADPGLEERFAQLKEQLLAQVEKAVPLAAARIIREEIQALLAQDMD